MIQLKCTLERKDTEIKEMKIEIDTHSEIMKTICPARMNSQDNANDRAGKEIESLRNQLAASNKIRDELKRSHAATINQKNAEIRSLKTAIKVLEDTGKEVIEKNDELQEKLEISKIEVGRANEINELLVKKAKNKEQSDGQSSKLPIFPSKPGDGESNQGTGQAEEGVKSMPARNDAVGRTAGSSSVETVNNPPRVPCLKMFNTGKCDVEGCKRNHKMKLKKVKRGICAYEFAARGSCPWKENCMFTHDIPPEKLSDKKEIQDQNRKKAELESKSKRSFRHDPNEGRKNKDDEKNGSISHGRKQQMLPSKQKRLKQLPKHSKETQKTHRDSGNGNHNKNDYEELNSRKMNLRYADRTHGQKKGSVFANGGKNTCKNDYNNDQIKEQNSFLCLIKPMIMDQMKIFVQDCIKEQMEEVKNVVNNVVSGQLTLI